MSQSDKVPNISGPMTPQETQKNAPVDPDKFKRLLKVEESDETQKRHKRNLKKQEEGDEEEGIEGPAPQAGVFQDLLQASKKSSIYEVTQPVSLPHLPTKAPVETPAFTSKLSAAQQALNMQQQLSQVKPEDTGELFFTPSLGSTAQAPLAEEIPPEVAPQVQSLQTQNPPTLVSTPTPTPTTTVAPAPASAPTESIVSTPLVELPSEAPAPTLPSKVIETTALPSTTKTEAKKESTETKGPQALEDTNKKPLPAETKAPMTPVISPKKGLIAKEEKISSLPFVESPTAAKIEKEIPKEKKPSIEGIVKEKELTDKGAITTPALKTEKTILSIPKPEIEPPKELLKEPSKKPLTLIQEAAKIKKEAEVEEKKETLAPAVSKSSKKEPRKNLTVEKELTAPRTEEEKTVKPTFVAMDNLLKKISSKEMPSSKEPLVTKEKAEEIAIAMPVVEKELKTVAQAAKETIEKIKDKEKEVETVVGPLPPALVEVSPIASEEFVYSRLNPEVFEIFQKMVGMLTIQKDTGVSTTTVTINKPGSIFNEGKLVLEHYDTAPHAFNVQFMGQDKAVALFNENLTDLIAAIEHAKLSYQVNIRRAVLAPRYRVETKEDLTKETKK